MTGDALAARESTTRRAAELVAAGTCPTCADLAGEGIYPADGDRLIHEDARFKVLLEAFPRVRGHTIVVYKPHREDSSRLEPEEVEPVFGMCLRVVHALQQGLGAEKVYLNTMCDGPVNHLHIQLFPRYAGEPIGTRRFGLPRGVLTNGAADAAAVARALGWFAGGWPARQRDG